MITANINDTIVKEKGSLSSGQFGPAEPVGQQNTGWISPPHTPWARHLCVVSSLHDYLGPWWAHYPQKEICPRKVKSHAPRWILLTGLDASTCAWFLCPCCYERVKISVKLITWRLWEWVGICKLSGGEHLDLKPWDWMRSLRNSEWNKKANGPRNSAFQRSHKRIGMGKGDLKKGGREWRCIVTERKGGEKTKPALRPPDVKSWLIRKDPDPGKDWGQEGKGTTEAEAAGWHRWLNGLEFEQTPGNGEAEGSLACRGPQGHRELNTTVTEQ